MGVERFSEDEERRAIAWWNSMTEQSRRTMLESPSVTGNPTPARCWEVFGKNSDPLYCKPTSPRHNSRPSCRHDVERAPLISSGRG